MGGRENRDERVESEMREKRSKRGVFETRVAR
jgi:hypothetical protein